MTKRSSSSRDEAVQTTFQLPADLKKRLEQAGGNRGLGEEIRRRLQGSFDAEQKEIEAREVLGDKVRELLGGIRYLATGAITIDGQWNEDPYLFRVFKSGVDTLLAYFEPKESAAAKAGPKKSFAVFNPEDPPETYGRILAGGYISGLTPKPIK